MQEKQKLREEEEHSCWNLLEDKRTNRGSKYVQREEPTNSTSGEKEKKVKAEEAGESTTRLGKRE